MCVCVCELEPQVHGRGCNSAHWFHSQRPPCNISGKVFLYGAPSKRLWRNLWGHEYVDEYPGEGRESFTAPTRAFYIKQGQSVGWGERKRGEERGRIEGDKVEKSQWQAFFSWSAFSCLHWAAISVPYHHFFITVLSTSIRLYWLCLLLYFFTLMMPSLPITAWLFKRMWLHKSRWRSLWDVKEKIKPITKDWLTCVFVCVCVCSTFVPM